MNTRQIGTALRKPAAIIGVGSLAFGLSAQPAAAIDTRCTPSEVAVFNEAPRLHVRCDESVGGIIFFAISTTDVAQAARTLSVIQSALIAGRTLVVRYDPNDVSGAAIGCERSDCRLIRAIGYGR